MYKMIIVEDKKITREGLRLLMDWNSIGVEIAATFESGNEAIQYLRDNPVDIVLTDIEMDNGTGIDLSEYIHKTYPDIKIIIITAFENFKYAKKALELGVFAYVLKPINQEEVMEKVSLAIEAMEKENEKKQLIHNLTRQQITKSLQELLDGAQSHLPLLKKTFHALPGEVRYTAISIKSRDLFHISSQDCRNVMGKYVNEAYVIRLNGFLTAIVLLRNQEILTDDTLNKIYLAISRNSRICVGETVDSLEELKHSLETSYTAYNYSFLHNKAGVIRWEDGWNPDMRHQNTAGRIYMEYSHLKNLIFQDKPAEYVEYIEQIFSTYQKNNMEKRFILSQCREALKYLCDTVNEYLMYKSIFTIDYSNMENREDLADVRAFFAEQITALHRLIQEKKNEKIRPIVKLALEYSMEHIDNPELNLKMIAGHLKVSYAYLSKAFKEDFQKSYTEYMNLYRIEIAKKKLLQSDEKIYEICDSIGLETKNFYYLFKKYEGITPKEFREMK